MKSVLSCAAVILCATLFTQTASGAVVIIGDTADVVLDPSGGSSDAAASRPSRIGASTAVSAGSRAGVFVFKLPEVPSGYSSTITQASLSFVVASIPAQPTYNIDLYGLGVRSTPTVRTKALPQSEDSDNYAGPNDETDAYKIYDNLIAAGQASVGTIVVDTNVFTQYVADQFTASYANGGGYLFLRLNPDVANLGAENSGIDVRFVGTVRNGPPAPSPDLPTLTIEFSPTAVPEPSTIGLVASGLTALLLRRRQR